MTHDGPGSQRIVAAVSNRASVLFEGRRDEVVAASFVGVFADRPCEAAERAANDGLDVRYAERTDRQGLSDELLAYAREREATWIVLFFGRILEGALLRAYEDRIVNIHPALLPSFKGLDGVGDTLASQSRFLGVTFHLIDDRVDEGRYLLQSVLPIDPACTEDELRARQFDQMIRGFVQVVRWIDADRVRVEGGRVVVDGATYDDPSFAPALEAAARTMTTPVRGPS